MVCPVCSSYMRDCFTARVLCRYDAVYKLCNTCGLLAVLEPFWLEEAHSSAVSASDTGLVMRNVSLSKQAAGVLYWLTAERGRGRYVDVAGGYGLFTRLMRDLGLDFYWVDKYCENVMAQGFAYQDSFGSCNCITAFEVLEHLCDPVAFIEETLATYGAHSILLSTELYSGLPPSPDDWYYYVFATGQHVSFFQRRTLQWIAKRLGLHFVTANGLHMFSKERINGCLYYAVTSLLSNLAAPWLRFRIGSRTMSDQAAIINNCVDQADE